MKRVSIKGVISAILSCVLIISSICMAAERMVYVYGDTTTQDLNSAKDKQQDINAQLEQTRNEIAQLQQSAADTQAYIAQLDNKLTELNTSLYNLNEQIDSKQVEITEAEEGLAQAQIDQENQYETMKLRIKFMYEHNKESYLDILLSSTNMGDLLNKAEYISKISEYDRQMLEEYKKTVDYIASTKQLLENDYAQLDEMRVSIETQTASLAEVQQAKNEELATINSQTAKAQEVENSLHSDLLAQESTIKAMEAQIAAQEAAAEKARQEAAAAAKAELNQNAANSNNSNANVSSGNNSSNSIPSTPTSSSGFVWPTVSRRITSDYGDTEDRSGPHQGIDIGATSPGVSGDPIYAAESGTVTISTYSSSAGNWIWIYHGNGVYTVYMHCSSLLVSVGSTVTKGQKIALMGSTGNSTGAHLHFGVRVNGSYVNPWKYLS